MNPSTEWKETPGPDEAAQFEAMAQALGERQQAQARRSGTTRRGLHAKAKLVALAEFEVLPDLPPAARVALFAEPRTYRALVRFSNGSGAVQEDRKPDVRGLAVKVLGVGGKKVIPGMEDCQTQDFLGILTPTIPFRDPADFVWVVLNSANPLSFLPKALVRFGPGKAATILGTLQKGLSRPLQALDSNRYFSAVPIRYGALAAKYSLEPLDASGQPGRKDGLGAQLAERLAQGPLRWDFRVQFFVDEKSTPIEDPSAEWTSPWVSVARLTLPRQELLSERGQQLTKWADTLSFDPWHAQQELRPLGAIMRARSPAYRVSNQLRGAAPEPVCIPPELDLTSAT